MNLTHGRYQDQTLHATLLVTNRNALRVPAVFIICAFYRKSTKDDIVKGTLHVYKMFYIRVSIDTDNGISVQMITASS